MPWSCYFFFYFGALYSDLQFSQGTLQAAEENCLEGFVCNYIFLRERKGKKGTFWDLKVLSPFPSTNNKQFCLFKCKGLGTSRVELREFKSEARHCTHWQCSYLEVPNLVPNSADITGLFHQDYLSYQGIYFPLPVCVAQSSGNRTMLPRSHQRLGPPGSGHLRASHQRSLQTSPKMNQKINQMANITS